MNEGGQERTTANDDVAGAGGLEPPNGGSGNFAVRAERLGFPLISRCTRYADEIPCRCERGRTGDCSQ